MRFVALLTGLAICHPTFADSLEIYNKLDVEEDIIPSEKIKLVTEKSVGGLTCTKVNHIVYGVSASCKLNLEKADSSAIYDALEVTEVPLHSSETKITYQKTASELDCVKTDNIVGIDFIRCKLTF